MKEFFKNSQDALVWCCKQGTMGNIYYDNSENPHSAMAVLGDFTYFDGEPSEDFALFGPPSAKKDYRIFVPCSKEWEEILEKCYEGKIRKITRYAMKKERDIFQKEQLKRAIETVLEKEIPLSFLDEKLFYECRKEEWSYDLTGQFSDFESFKKLGIGVVAVKNGEILAGASTYARYDKGIEIEVDTKSKYRRMGLAYGCSAAFILACLEQEIYPGWDAHNLASRALAEKLGYHFLREYVAYEVYEK